MVTIFVLRCRTCEHEWIEDVRLPMVLEAFCIRLRASVCPKCCSRQVDMLTGNRYFKARARLLALEQRELLEEGRDV